MANPFKDSPVAEFLNGTREAWLIVSGPWLAGAMGVILGVFVLDQRLWEDWVWAVGLLFLLLPILDLLAVSWGALLFAAAIIALTIKFWFARQHRLEWLFLLCLLVMGNVVYLGGGFEGFGWPEAGRVGGSLVFLGVLYCVLRFPRLLWWWGDRRRRRR